MLIGVGKSSGLTDANQWQMLRLARRAGLVQGGITAVRINDSSE